MSKLQVWDVLWLLVLTAAACDQPDHRIQLVELPVNEMERAVTFYRDVFGWDASHPDSSYAILAATPVAIGLVLRDSVTASATVIVIESQDLETILSRVVNRGGIVRQAISPSWRGRQFRFADLDGNELVVWSESTEPGESPRS